MRQTHSDNPETTAADTSDPTVALTPDTHGTWLVTTQGSEHVWNITAQGVTYQRNPGPATNAFDSDGEPLPLTRVDRWPAVGETFFIWFDDPTYPFAIEQWRQSSTVRSITLLAPAGHGGDQK
jgi:hypothetical protein